MLIIVDKSKKFSLIPKKLACASILLLLQSDNSRSNRYASFQFFSFMCDYHCVKSVCIRSFSGQYFPEFGLNSGRYFVCSPHAGKYRPEKFRIRTLFTQGVAHHYLLALHTSKTIHLPNTPLYACDIKLNSCKKSSQGKGESRPLPPLLTWEMETQLSMQSLSIY